jgi:uridine kinase
MDTFEELLRHIAALPFPPTGPQIIGISGFGGSGKSTLARKLAAALADTATVSIDDFWQPERDARDSDWNAFDRERLEHDVLQPARRGELLQYTVFDRTTQQWDAFRAVPPSRRLIVEGVSVLHPSLLPYYDCTVWIECPIEVAEARGIHRDLHEYGEDTTERWQTIWTPNERDYFAKYRPDTLADIHYRAEVQ